LETFAAAKLTSLFLSLRKFWHKKFLYQWGEAVVVVAVAVVVVF